MSSMSSLPLQQSYDVIVVGGGPAGSTVATCLARAGVDVAVFEQAAFPRFHVGESLLPANVPIFERLGCHEAIQQAGFLVKPGASFFDDHEGRGVHSFAFQPHPFQPGFSYNVVRAPFDALLLQHASALGAKVYQQHTVKQPRFDTDRVRVQVADPQGASHEVQARFLVDASGRAVVIGGHVGKREPLPDLGKVALFAHFRGAPRDPDVPNGNIRIHTVRDGWVWWIPFADGTDSLGCVLHARVVKERGGSVERLFDEVVATSPRLTQALHHAQRLTPVHTAANFSYRVTPSAGPRFLAVGDAAGFVDPIFSAGVFVAMRSAELAADTILHTFQHQRASDRAGAAYVARVRRGMAPFLALIQRFYDPAFLDLFLSSAPPHSLYRAVLWVLSGAAFDRQPLWLRRGLYTFYAAVGMQKALRWTKGAPAGSRWHW